MKQSTIKKAIGCSGIGLHSGKVVRLSLSPAPEDTGIVFHIHGENGCKVITPEPHAVIATGLATTLGLDGTSVATVEHLLAAIAGLQIDNIRIDIEGGEVPIMDGSAASFVFLLRDAGIAVQNRTRTVQRITKPIHFERDGKYISASPYAGLRIDYTIDFDHPLIGRQTMSVEVTPATFTREIAKARTFGFLREVEYLHKNGLALGGSLDNAIVLDEYGVLNEDGLRFDDEFVRHKILDFIGDMSMLGAPLQGHFEVFASGHALNNQFLRTIQEHADIYLETVEMDAFRPEAVPAREHAGQPVAA
ncbi:UDP-3-O-acyl-N-acetylglucosamine deacetylase [Desulfovibrio psychrotolerans]|uniref:UDP-3-O-acyl-N-acetylglucosamine deacetylase n=1 Tax=Desulfovibrio psychrotolerans TaxID=415242 RepID=A0A7J0BVW7_9BACT|nr:UDP-3-O-acyl-N-acetylglucosamine deacetylase [Desulfovibrio psychrotolerans]GFM37857.1 UDP-3-O-acyl-N-acetylglucosamine deacetylase [Desulfovibrio psychrotolerans]